ncbi:MAG: PAS domain S-box protein [Chitinophagaceae bacterium]|nr:MAG: PAS domain S-box protein [Chitinophagaceae bacterium]
MQNTANNDDLFQLKRLIGEVADGDEFQQKINDFLPAIVYVYDAEQKKLRYINKKITDVLGYTFEEVSAWDDGLLKLVFSEDLERVKEEIDKFYLLEGDSTHLYECRLNSKQGEWRYFRTRGTVLRRSESGKPGSMLFVAEDITENIRSTEEIRQLRQLQHETESLLGFGVYNYTLSTGDIRWSDGIYDILEYTKGEEATVINFEKYLAHVTAEDRDMLRNVMEKSIEARSTFTATYRVITLKGNRKVISTRGKLVVNGDGIVEKVVGSMLDITEDVARQEELETYKRNMDEKEQLLDFGSWENDLINDTIHWSDGMYRIFGYEPREYAGLIDIDRHLYKKHMQPDDFDRSVHIRSEAIKNKDEFTTEFNITGNTGVNKRLQSFAKIIRNDKQEAIKVIGTTRNITQLRAYESNLESIVNDLNRSNKDLEEFAYIASHDLQEPLRKLSTFSERLVTRHSAELSPEAKKYTERILGATENMRILIENLLEFSRTARSSIPFSKVDMNDVMSQVLSDLEIVIEQSGADIHVDKLPVLEAIPSQIQQLFSNLVGNALKFKKPEGNPGVNISVSLLSTEEQLNHKLKPGTSYYCIQVKDNGIGFEKEYATKIFQIFQRLHGKVEYPGSGVGLAICKKIVDNHRGLIWAEGTPGEGSTFTVILPEKHI